MNSSPSPQNGSTRYYLIAGAAVILFLLVVFLLFNMRQPAASPQAQISVDQAMTMVAHVAETAFAASPQAQMSVDQAMTMVAHVTETAYAADPHPAVTSANSFAQGKPAAPTRPAPATLSQTALTQAAVAYEAQPTSASLYYPQEQPTYPIPNYTVRPSYTPKPPDTQRPPANPTATRTPKPPANPGLPGLTVKDITDRLTSEKGFTCKQESGDSTLSLWMCDYQSGYDIWYHVDIYSTAALPVSSLMASVFQSTADDQKAAEILGFVAALPYTGSNPSAALQWVTQTLPGITGLEDVRKKTFGKVPYKLYGTPQGRYLEMGILNQ